MGDVKLSTPHLRILRDGQDPLEIQSTNADLVLWDRTAFRHKWPKPTDAPFLWMTFIGWAAARRTGAINPDHKYETWESEVLSVETIEDEEDEEGTPTTAGLDPA
jgi:hypothetical protein